VATLLAVSPAQAEDLLDPHARCADVLAQDHEDFVLIRTGWAMGYLSATTGDVPAIGEDLLEGMIEMLDQMCEAAPDTPFVELVAAVANP
jgi:hypothetical protein